MKVILKLTKEEWAEIKAQAIETANMCFPEGKILDEFDIEEDFLSKMSASDAKELLWEAEFEVE